MGDASGAVAFVSARGDVRGRAVPAGKSNPAPPRHAGSRIIGERPTDGRAIEMTQLAERERQPSPTPDEVGILGDDGAGAAGARAAAAARHHGEEAGAKCARTAPTMFADCRPAPDNPSIWAAISGKASRLLARSLP